MDSALIICLGNAARGDDAVGRATCELLDGRLPHGTRLLSLHALDVVLAEEVASATFVVFVDAQRRIEPSVAIEPIEPAAIRPDAHIVDPAGLLALTRALYGTEPRAVMVTVAAPHMEHDDELSPQARSASIAAADAVAKLVAEETGRS